MKFGIVVFPGSTCERDAFNFITGVLKQECIYLWHQHALPADLDCILLPGGFSYGDYLRPGAIAARARIMDSIKKFVYAGGLVIGICNGFQVLIEAGLLPGTLLKNRQISFKCRWVDLRVENNATVFTRHLKQGDLLQMPIAHGDGNYYIRPKELERLRQDKQIIFKYVDKNGNQTAESNPNDSVDNIAGIINKEGNVLGMMPHPERAGEAILGSTHGLKIFESILAQEGEMI